MCYKHSLVSDCLKVGVKSVTTQIPLNRLTRVGKGTTFCRTWKQEGRMTVSGTDLRRSNRLPWRCYANSGGTWLWIRCTSGHGCGLLIDRSQGWNGAKTAADLRHHHTRTTQSARMVVVPRLHACGHGEHRSLLEAGLCPSGRSLSDGGGQRATRQESPRSQDRCQRCRVDRGSALPRAAPLQLC